MRPLAGGEAGVGCPGPPLLGQRLGEGDGVGLDQQPPPPVLRLEQEAVGGLLEVMGSGLDEEAVLDLLLEDDAVQIDGLEVLPRQQLRPRGRGEVVRLSAGGVEEVSLHSLDEEGVILVKTVQVRSENRKKWFIEGNIML